MKTTRTLCISLLTLVPVLGMVNVTQAQTTHKKNIIKRHPVASSLVAGAAAHHYAKKHSHGFMHRHATATGVAAAAATHHYAKKK